MTAAASTSAPRRAARGKGTYSTLNLPPPLSAQWGCASGTPPRAGKPEPEGLAASDGPETASPRRQAVRSKSHDRTSSSGGGAEGGGASSAHTTTTPFASQLTRPPSGSSREGCVTGLHTRARAWLASSRRPTRQHRSSSSVSARLPSAATSMTQSAYSCDSSTSSPDDEEDEDEDEDEGSTPASRSLRAAAAGSTRAISEAKPRACCAVSLAVTLAEASCLRNAAASARASLPWSAARASSEHASPAASTAACSQRSSPSSSESSVGSAIRADSSSATAPPVSAGPKVSACVWRAVARAWRA